MKYYCLLSNKNPELKYFFYSNDTSKSLGHLNDIYRRYRLNPSKYKYYDFFEILKSNNFEIRQVEGGIKGLDVKTYYHYNYRQNNLEKIKEQQKERYNKIEKEKYKQLYLDRKEKHNRLMKTYRENNKEKIKKNLKEYYERTKQYIKCECGSVILDRSYTLHLSSKKHNERCAVQHAGVIGDAIP